MTSSRNSHLAQWYALAAMYALRAQAADRIVSLSYQFAARPRSESDLTGAAQALRASCMEQSHEWLGQVVMNLNGMALADLEAEAVQAAVAMYETDMTALSNDWRLDAGYDTFPGWVTSRTRCSILPGLTKAIVARFGEAEYVDSPDLFELGEKASDEEVLEAALSEALVYFENVRVSLLMLSFISEGRDNRVLLSDSAKTAHTTCHDRLWEHRRYALESLTTLALLSPESDLRGQAVRVIAIAKFPHLTPGIEDPLKIQTMQLLSRWGKVEYPHTTEIEEKLERAISAGLSRAGLAAPADA